MKGRKRFKSTMLALLLSLSMVVTYLPASMIAYATDETAVEIVEDEAGINADSAQDIGDESEGEEAPADLTEDQSGEEDGVDGVDVDADLAEPEAETSSQPEMLDGEVQEEEPVVKANPSKNGKTVLAFTSDIHNGAGGIESNISNNRLTTWLSKVMPMYDNAIQLMGFCGDMAGANTDSSSFWTCTQRVMENVGNHNMEGVYAVGNHEYGNGSFATTSNSPEVRAKYSLNKAGHAVSDENYVIYCLGTNSSHGSDWAYDDSQITTLTEYLNSVSNDKVIIILTHFPLHNYGMHNTGNTVPVLNAINAAALGSDGNYGTLDDKKIVFLWGHNHSEGDNNYDQVWLPEDKINDDNKSTVYFYYAAAGCMADAEYGSSAKVLGKGLVLTINEKKQLSFAYYDANGNDVTEGGPYIEQDPVYPTSITVSPKTLEVEVGRTSKPISVSYQPDDTNQKGVTWTSSDPSVATVKDGKVKGVSTGTATITATSADGACSDTATVTVIPRSTEQTYYIIKIGNYVLSTERSTDSSNGGSSSGGWGWGGSGNTYTGLAAVDYSAATSNDETISWIIEETDGGYYIMSQDGRYLNATYTSSGSSGWGGGSSTSDLKLDDTPDVWVLDAGKDLDSWVDGSYLKSSNTDRYLCEETGTSGSHLFSVRSKDNADETSIEDADSLGEEVTATAIAVSPKTATVEAGSTKNLKVTFTPDNTTNKKITWSSSDTKVATVSSSGVVTGVAKGSAVITATYTDNTELTDTCTVTVTKAAGSGVEPEAGKKYVILASDGYALTSEGKEVGYDNGSGDQVYHYYGLAGEKYTVGENVAPDRLLWTFTASEDGKGYYIQDQNGKYLNATYGANNEGGSTGRLKLDDTKDVWVISGATSGDVVNANILQSTNATDGAGSGKYLTHGNGENGGDNTNIFTVRSEDNATATTFYEYSDDGTYVTDPDDPTPVDPPVSTSVDITPTTDNPSKNATINVGDTLTINVTNSSDRNDYDYTATLSNSDIAQIVGNATITIDKGATGQFTVKGRAAGTVDINIQNNQSNSQYARKGVIHLTVVDSGAGPVDPPTPVEGNTYKLVDQLTDGNEYLIVSANSAGSGYALTNPGGTSGGATMGRTAVTIESGDVDGDGTADFYITSDATNIVWTATANKSGFNLTNDGGFLEGKSGSVKIFNPQQYEDRYWTYTNSSLKHNGGQNTYVVYYSSNNFTSGTSGDNKVYIYEKTEQAPGTDSVTGVTLNKTSTTLTEGATETLVAKVAPTTAEDKSVTWTTSDAAVATVDQTGKVTAVKAGITTITVTTTDGGYTATCAVTVEAPTPVEGNTYKLVDQLANGGEYLIVSANSVGSGYALTNPGGTSGGATMGRTAVTIESGDVDGDGTTDCYITSDATNIVWTAATNGSGFNISNNGDTLEGKSGEVKIYNSVQYADRYWTYNDSQLQHHGGQNTYTVYYSSNFTSSYNSTSEKIYIYEKTQTTPVVHTHTWSDWVVTAEPTCTVKGVETSTCSKCGETKTREIDALGHVPGDEEIENNVEPTCTTAGSYDKVVHCTRCEIEISRETVTVPALDHHMEAHAAVAATCTADGNRAFWSCDRCNKYFSDEAGTTEITAGSWIIPAVGHTPGEPVHENERAATCTTAGSYEEAVYCTVCGVELDRKPATTDPLGHDWSDWVVTTPATELMEGVETKTCSRCGETDTQAIPKLPHTHHMTSVAASEPTCTTDGNTAYWICNLGDNPCRKYFSDAAGTEDIEIADTVISATGHTPGDEVIDKNVDPTCTATGRYDKVVYCTVCEEEISRETVIVPARGHAWGEWTESKPATELEEGERTRTCSVCGETDTSVIPKLDHVHHTTKVDATAATCTEAGNIEHWVCSEGENPCRRLFEDEKATKELNSEDVIIPATGHDWGAPTWTWANDNSSATATFTCKNDESHVEEVEAVVTSTTTEATCEADGKTVYTATAELEGRPYTYVKEVTISATGHDYELTGWTWAEDYSSAIATFTCKNDPAHVETVEARVTSATTNATCEKPGKKVYTAIATFDKEDYTDTKETSIPAIGHDYGVPTYVWADDYSTVTATRVCANDSSHVETETATTTYAVVTPATDTTSGTGRYTSVQFGNKAFAVQTMDVEIPPTGYDVSYVWNKTDDGYTVTGTAVPFDTSAQTITETVDATYAVTTPATCTAPGEGTWTSAAFTKSQFAVQTKKEPIEALGHNLAATAAKAATCDEAGNTEYWTCSKCSKFYSDAEGKTEIASGSWTIPAKGHDWGTTDYKWADDNSTVTATRVCKNDPAHVETETASATYKVTTHATETAAGEGTWSAEFENAAFEAQTKTVEIPRNTPAPGSEPNQGGADGPVGPGASAASAERAITGMTSDTDLPGAAFGTLTLRSPKQGKTSIQLNWTGVSGASKYVIYGNKCGAGNKPVKIAEVSGTTITFSSLAKGTYYKYVAVALNGNNNVVSTSKLIHVATKGGKVGNHKSVKVTKAVTKKAKKLKVGKSLKLKAKAVPQSKKLKVKKHVGVRYESSDPSIATVSSKGKVKGVRAGTCYVYAYAQNGVFKTIKVVVK